MVYTLTKNEEFNSLEIAFDGIPSNQIRTNLKNLHFKWHGLKKVWYGFADEETVKAAIEGNTIETPMKKENNFILSGDMLKECVAPEYEKVWGKDTSMYNWAIKRDVVGMKFDDLVYVIEKPKIETRFCFGYGMYGISTEEDYQDAAGMCKHAETNEDYFKNENLKDYNRHIKDLKDALESNGFEKVYLISTYSEKSNLVFYQIMTDYKKNYDCHYSNELFKKVLSNEEIEKLIALYEEAKRLFEKRLDAYLKRYGLSKLHCWTYLVD